ncbi:MAG: DDE-type integrase/transposase/recombinase [Pseudomonadota bacterium]|nr:DDE-type integrase/transposase/recombinase [Pseudomonadota bacterium]
MSGKTHYTCAELAALKLPGYPGTERAWRDLVERETWEYSEVKARGGRGGVRREYLPPERLLKQIAHLTHARTQGADARHTLAARNMAHAEVVAEQARKQAVTADQLMGLLTPKGQEKFGAHYDVLLAWRDWFAQQMAQTPKLGRNTAFGQFAEAWNAGHVPSSDTARAKYPAISMRTIQRWVLANEKNGLAPVADMRCSGIKRKKSVFETTPLLHDVFIGILSEKPHIQSIDLLAMLNKCRYDRETGEVLFEPLRYDQVTRYRAKWSQQNAAALMLTTNPDQFKSRYLSSLGQADADVHRMNQLWEMDGTPADWLLNHGSGKSRYTASVVIDVWSRRPMIRFSRTAKTETNKQLMRDAVLAWGVPDGKVKTDNGSDYKSHEFRLFLEEIGVEQVFCPPFSPQKKPHVERFIGTYLHSLLEVLDAFVGHNVTERSAIDAKKTFAEHLFKKGGAVSVDLTVEELQALSDAWVEGTYMQREHRTLGMTPFARVASSTTPIKRIENERALDMLLMKPVKNPPTISAKGIRYERVDYIHEELPLHAGKLADIRLDPMDMGKIIVRVDGKFLCVAVNASLAGVPRAEIAAKGHAKQQDWMRDTRAMFKKAKKGLVSPDQLVREIVMERAARAGKLAVLKPRGETHTSAGLDDAARVLAAQDTQPAFSAKAEQLIAEAKALMNQFNPKADVLQMPSKADRMGADNPLSGFSDEEKYTLWFELDAVVSQGGEGVNSLTHDWQRRFHAGFCKTSKFAAMTAMKEAFGGGS